MDLFYRWQANFGHGYGPPSVKELAEHLSAAAARLAFSILLALPKLPEAARNELAKLFNVSTLWGLSLVFAAWGFATVLGGAIGLAINVLLIGYGLSSLWGEISRAADDFKAWFVAAYNASTDAELDAASTHFAAAVANGGITVIEAILTHKVFKSVERTISRKYPPPKTLEAELEAKKRPRSRLKEAAKDLAERAKTTLEATRGEGARTIASEFPATEVAIAVGVVAVGACVAIILSESSK